MSNLESHSNSILSINNNSFIFHGSQIAVETETRYDSTGTKLCSAFLYHNDSEHKNHVFAFNTEHGLFLQDNNGNRDHNVINNLINISINDYTQYNTFFKKYGFIFDIEQNEHISVRYETISSFILHFKFVLQLLSELNLNKPNYEKIYILTSKLLFSEVSTIELKRQKHQTCMHNIKKLADAIGNDLTFPETDLSPWGHIIVSDSLSETADTIFEESDWLNMYIPYYTDDVYEAPYANKFRQLMAISDEYDKTTKEIIEFYYHIEDEQIKNIHSITNIDTEIIYCFDNQRSQPLDNNPKFSEPLKKRLLKVAEYVVNEEMEHVLHNLQPQFNASTMTANWIIPDLYTALFFSIIYLHKDKIYRTCKNEYCNKPFLVSSTNHRKLYCCANCAGAVATRNYQKRRRQS